MFEQHLHPLDSQLNEYLDGELAASERLTLETHLAACPVCQARLVELHGLFQQLAGLPDLALNQNPQVDSAYR